MQTSTIDIWRVVDYECMASCPNDTFLSLIWTQDPLTLLWTSTPQLVEADFSQFTIYEATPGQNGQPDIPASYFH